MDTQDRIPCPRCNSRNTHIRHNNSQRKTYQCVDCKKKGKTSYFEPDKKQGSQFAESVSESGNTREITTKTNVRITSLEQLIEFCQIDTSVWEIERWVCNKWEGIMPDIGAIPLFQVKVWLRRKVEEIRTANLVRELIEDAKSYAPRYVKIQYPRIANGLLYEIDMPDLQFGRLAWDKETGQDYKAASFW